MRASVAIDLGGRTCTSGKLRVGVWEGIRSVVELVAVMHPATRLQSIGMIILFRRGILL